MPRYARSTPVLDTAKEQVGQDTTIHMPVTGAPRLERESDVEAVHSGVDPKWAEEMKFMEEIVVINIHPSPNPNEEKWVPLFNNGRAHYVLRGVDTPVKRKYVEVLLNAKKTTYGNIEDRDHEGNLRVRYPSQTGLMYPFQVVEDKNPKGMEWLKKKLSQPA